MACTANKTQFLRTVAVRSYSAQASPKVASKKSSEIETTTLPNKVVVASVESNSPISRVSVLFRAGSRNESYDNLGATHLIRSAASLSNKKSTGFGLTRNIQQIGGSLSCNTDREIVEYNVELTRNQLDVGLQYLSDISTQHIFKPWELNDNVKQIKGDLARVSPQARAVDLVHRAAFHTELGNSIFCAKHHVGKISPETLQHYVGANFTAGRTAVVGVGVDHQFLVGFAKSLKLKDGQDGAVTPSKYHGFGELRVDKAGSLAHVAVATQGGSLANQKEALAFAVLQYVAGAGASTKRGNVNGALGKVVTSAIGNEPFGFSAFNASYTDNGLFGFVLSAEAKSAGKAIDAAVKALRQGSVSDGDVKRAKEQLKVAVLNDIDSESHLVSDIGAQAVLLGNVQGTAQILAAIDGVSTADVNAAAKKVASGKWSVGAVGNLATVPYVSQLN